MESRGERSILSLWSITEQLLFKECADHLTTVGTLDASHSEKMYNNVVKKYSTCSFTFSPTENSSVLTIIPRERSSGEIQRKLSRIQKENEVFKAIFKNQTVKDFEAP